MGEHWVIVRVQKVVRKLPFAIMMDPAIVQENHLVSQSQVRTVAFRWGSMDLEDDLCLVRDGLEMKWN